MFGEISLEPPLPRCKVSELEEIFSNGKTQRKRKNFHFLLMSLKNYEKEMHLLNQPNIIKRKLEDDIFAEKRLDVVYGLS